MNLYGKVQKMRVDLQNMKVKKTGENKFAGYKYYELGDILPPINQLMLENGVASVVSFNDDLATLRLVNCENPEEFIEFTSPMAGATLKGAHDIQNLGAVETYQRRYLYMVAFEVVESDFFDATQGKPEPQKPEPPKQKKQATMSEAVASELNEAIKNYANLTSQPLKEVVASIQKEMGKPTSQMNDADGGKVLNLIHDWTDKFIAELGA